MNLPPTIRIRNSVYRVPFRIQKNTESNYRKFAEFREIKSLPHKIPCSPIRIRAALNFGVSAILKHQTVFKSENSRKNGLKLRFCAPS
jgi:hypothetical protein